MIFPVKLYCHEVVDRFFSRFLLCKNIIKNLIIVSPWITYTDFKVGSLTNVIKKIHNEKIPTYIITRTPIIDSHKEVINKFKEIKNTEINLYDDLHAKIFISDCEYDRFALIGSANLTRNSSNNFEIGVFINGRGDGDRLIKQLYNISIIDLRINKQIILNKKMGV